MEDTSKISDVGSSESLPITVDSNTNTIDTQDSKKRKAMQPRSDVWNHFDKFEVNGVGKARCRYCKQAYAANSSKNGTTGLKNHLLRCKEYPLKIAEDNSQTKLNFQFCQNDEGSIWKFDQKVVRRALIEMIVTDELPFSFVENEGFMKFMRKTQPLFRIPSRRTITRNCYEVYGELRWNSTYLMLDTAQHFEKAFDKLHLFYDGFSAYQCSHLCEDGGNAGPLESDDWVNVRNVIEFLARFHELTKKVLGSRYVTCNSHFEDVSELYCHLKMCLASEDEHLRKMAQQMQEKFKKYWGEPEKMNKMIFIASVLDPRNKFEYVEGALEELFGEEKGKKINAEVYAYMNSLFGEYLKKYSTESCPQSPSSSTSSNNTSNTPSGSVISASKIRTKLSLKKQKEDNGNGGAKSELDKYISEEQEPYSEEFDILSWWKTHAPRFSILSELARDVLAISISSVASECAFSTGGRILDSFRSSLTPKCVQALICLQNWLREEKNHINVEEDLKYLEEIELGSSAIMPRATAQRPVLLLKSHDCLLRDALSVFVGQCLTLCNCRYYSATADVILQLQMLFLCSNIVVQLQMTRCYSCFTVSGFSHVQLCLTA
ncbi:zinc finger BED domain-containing protein RICESLEEPER 2-like [Nicotiana sylvestris]|uniref:zinc finger BED domain-containing protein RICESLEEPER 2-like n=1 Tax=Nicotiana sylvestris TaxID=4096 RepID=UPI00388CBDD9